MTDVAETGKRGRTRGEPGSSEGISGNNRYEIIIRMSLDRTEGKNYCSELEDLVD
jgi:hypothetical protein